jgi:hypothetical protein
MSDNGLVTLAGRILRGQLVAGIPATLGLSWFAVGDGNAGWTTTPPNENEGATGLIHEVVRKRITRTAYLVEDVAGAILYKADTWAETETPTPVMAFFTTLTGQELSGLTIIEEALFGGLVETSASPVAYAGQVQTPGVCYWVRNRAIYVPAAQDTFTAISIFEEIT